MFVDDIAGAQVGLLRCVYVDWCVSVDVCAYVLVSECGCVCIWIGVLGGQACGDVAHLFCALKVYMHPYTLIDADYMRRRVGELFVCVRVR
jgi:hypothetical protein